MRTKAWISGIAAAGLLAGCGSSSSSSAAPPPSGSASSSTAATPSASPTANPFAATGKAVLLGSSCKGTKPSGKPYKIYDLIELASPEAGGDGAQAAAQAITACGGINGRPVELVQCQTLGNQAAALKCANSAVSDPDAIAAGGVSSSEGDLSDPVFEKAGMAVTGLIGPGADGTSPVFFGTNLGGLITAVDGAYAVNELKAKSLGVPYFNYGNFGTAALSAMDSLVTKPNSLPAAKGVPIDITEVNYPAKVAAMGSPDGVAPALTGNLFTSFLQEARNDGHNYPFVFNTAVLSETEAVKSLKDEKNTYILSTYRLSGKGYDMFLADMNAAKKTGASINGQSIQGWLSVRVIADAANTVGSNLTRGSLLAALKSLSNYDTLGLTPSINFTAKQAGKQFANIVNPTVVYYKVEGGKFSPIDGEQFHGPGITIP